MQFLRKVLLFVVLVMSVQAISREPEKKGVGETVDEFIERMVATHQMDKAELNDWFNQAKVEQRIIDSMNRPAEGLPWHKYRKIWMTKERIDAAVEFWNQYQTELTRAETTFKVPASMIVGILGVETYFGRIKGNIPVWNALYTLAFHYPKRAKFFRGELEQFLLLAREQEWSVFEPKGSYAGAMGWGQFIPTSYRNYAVDFDGDGKIDLINNPIDAIGSVANYFRVHKWRWGEPVAFQVAQNGNNAKAFAAKRLKPVHTVADINKEGYQWPVATNEQANAALYGFDQVSGKEYWVGFDNFYVITRYNRSPLYALAVYQFSREVIARRAKAYLHG